MRNVLLSLILGVGLSFSWQALADDEPLRDLPETPTNIEAKDAGIRDILHAVMTFGGMNFVIHSGVDNSIKINLRAKQEPWDLVFKSLLRRGHLSYAFDEHKVLHIFKRKAWR